MQPRRKAVVQLLAGSALVVAGVVLTLMKIGPFPLMLVFPGIPLFFAGLASLKTPENRTP
jgi:hypothetical protein